MTKVQLELIPDPYIYIFFEKGARNGVSYISNRYSKDKNKYLEPYDPKQMGKRIIYLKANNLCGYAMSKFLPTSGFKWIDPKDSDLNKYTSNSSKVCLLEDDLEYLKGLRELVDDYHLAPDKTETKRNTLSNYKLAIADLYNSLIFNVKKLVRNILIKKQVTHYGNLQRYLTLGLTLKKYIMYYNSINHNG